jgi:hypothetical protein
MFNCGEMIAQSSAVDSSKLRNLARSPVVDMIRGYPPGPVPATGGESAKAYCWRR